MNNSTELLRLLEHHHAAWAARDFSSAKDLPYASTELCVETGSAIAAAKDAYGLGDPLRTRVPTWTCNMKFHTRAEYDAHRAPEPDARLSQAPEIRYQLRDAHHVTCLVAGGACTCLEWREKAIAELAVKAEPR